MRQQTNQLLGIKEPQDGFTQEEQSFMRLAHDFTIGQIYAMFPTSRMKAIVALHFELGYNQELVAQMFGVSQEQIALELEMCRTLLLGKPSPRSKTGQPYKPGKPKKLYQMTVADLLKVALVLNKQ